MRAEVWNFLCENNKFQILSPDPKVFFLLKLKIKLYYINLTFCIIILNIQN